MRGGQWSISVGQSRQQRHRRPGVEQGFWSALLLSRVGDRGPAAHLVLGAVPAFRGSREVGRSATWSLEARLFSHLEQNCTLRRAKAHLALIGCHGIVRGWRARAMRNLNRRIFLRGLGGAVVAAPFLGSLFERSARAGFVAPRRTIVMFTHYGHITNKWFPNKLDGDLTAADLTPTTLAPLSPYASKLLMPRGIRTMNEWTVDNKGAGHGRGQGNDIHTQLLGSLLTCQPVTPNSNDPFSFNTATKYNCMPVGPSLDHVIAQQLSPSGVPLLLSVAGINGSHSQEAISYRAAETLFDPVSASDAFSKLIGLLDPGASMNGDTYALVRGKAVTDLGKDDLSSLARKDMSKSDKDKLAAWMDLTNDLGKVVAGQCNQALVDKLGAANSRNTTASTGTDVITRRINDSMDNADLYAAIAALTAACNANPVILLKYPINFTFSGLG